MHAFFCAISQHGIYVKVWLSIWYLAVGCVIHGTVNLWALVQAQKSCNNASGPFQQWCIGKNVNVLSLYPDIRSSIAHLLPMALRSQTMLQPHAQGLCKDGKWQATERGEGERGIVRFLSSPQWPPYCPHAHIWYTRMSILTYCRLEVS